MIIINVIQTAVVVIVIPVIIACIQAYLSKSNNKKLADLQSTLTRHENAFSSKHQYFLDMNSRIDIDRIKAFRDSWEALTLVYTSIPMGFIVLDVTEQNQYKSMPNMELIQPSLKALDPLREKKHPFYTNTSNCLALIEKNRIILGEKNYYLFFAYTQILNRLIVSYAFSYNKNGAIKHWEEDEVLHAWVYENGFLTHAEAKEIKNLKINKIDMISRLYKEKILNAFECLSTCPVPELSKEQLAKISGIEDDLRKPQR